MAHANAVLAALYHFKPLRNLAFATELVSREEEAYDEALYSLQLLFAKMYLGGTVNAAVDLEKTYLSAESLESHSSDRFVDPFLFYSWCSRARIFKSQFDWKLETISEFADSDQFEQILQSESPIFEIDSSSISTGHSLQNHLDALQVGVEVLTDFTTMGKPAAERALRRRTKFLELPKILTFRILPQESSAHPVILKSTPSPRAHLSISSSLRLGGDSFQLYAVVCVSSSPEPFQTFIQVDANEWMLYESDSPAQSVPIERVLTSASSSGYLFFYSQPEYMNASENKSPSVDLGKAFLE